MSGSGAVSRLAQQWLAARVPASDNLVLTHRNIYILPTRAGMVFALTLLTLLIASINYQLNLGYLLTFLLAGSALASMHITHGTLRGLTLHLRRVAPVHAGDAALLEVVLAAPGTARAPRHGIGLKVGGASDATLSWSDVPGGAQVTSQITFVTAARGRHPLPPLVAESRFPLGLFRAWTVWRPAAQLLVYPALERPAPPLPTSGRGPADGSARLRGPQGAEVEGIRAYRHGDTLKDVAWKKAAQSLESGGNLVSRDRSAVAARQLWLEWQHSGSADEQRLSRLAAWVLAADAANVAYGLRLPGTELAPAHGDAQRRACLERLALWGAT